MKKKFSIFKKRKYNIDFYIFKFLNSIFKKFYLKLKYI